MKTQEALDRFFKRCQDRGLSPETIRTYGVRLKHFAAEYPELPTEPGPIERFLKARHETPTKRGTVYAVLQAFYSYLESNENIPSPVPPKGKIGRPRRIIQERKLLPTFEADSQTLPEGKLLQGGSSVSKSISLSTQEVCDAFLSARGVQGITEATDDRYRKLFRRFTAEFPILPLTPEPIEKYLTSLQVSGITRWSYWSALKALYHWLQVRRHIPSPFRDSETGDLLIARPSKERKVRETLELDQVKELLALPLSPRDRALVLLLMDCGPRRGEICTLTRENVKSTSIVIRGKEGEVEVHISPQTHDLLVQLAPSGYLFRSRHGPMSPSGLYQVIQKLLARIGKTTGKRGPHLFRHTMGRAYMEGSGDLLSLKETLGHRQVETTQQYGAMSKVGIFKRHAESTPLKRLLTGTEPLIAHCKKCHKPAMIDGLRAPVTRCLHCQTVGQWNVNGSDPSVPPTDSANPRPAQGFLELTSGNLDTELVGRGEAIMDLKEP